MVIPLSFYSHYGKKGLSPDFSLKFISGKNEV